MFIKDFFNEFYKCIHGKQCLVLVNFDVDAICACKILQSLFKNDNIVYSVVPVQGLKDMVQAYEDKPEDVEYVIMVNCGGTINIYELLKPDEKVVFFILDSHRPYDLNNIYNDRQIKILGESTEEDEIPNYTDVFNDESSDEEGEENEDDDGSENEDIIESSRAKRMRLAEKRALKKRRVREWEEKRDVILFNYSQYSFYGKPSAVLAYELTWRMSRDNLDMIWWAIIGSTEHTILNKVESSTTALRSMNLQNHVSRLSHSRGNNIDTQQSSAMRLMYDKDLQLALYRHWTVEDSLKHSMPTAVALRLWSIKGDQKLKQLLAEMGLPLYQSKQKFSSMDISLKQEFKSMIEKLADKFRIRSIVSGSFTLQFGFRFKYCASDVVYAMLAILESTSRDRSADHCFMEAMDCLFKTNKDLLDKGIEKAKNMLVHIYKTAQSILELKQVVNAGSFLYIIIAEGMLGCHLFSHPHAIQMLAQFILKAYVESSRNRRAASFPLVASAHYSDENGTCILVGIPPVSEEQPRSLFGKAFVKAAENTNSYIEPDYFDTTIARLKTEDRPKFFDALAALLD